jgi:hypothetical protein
MKFKNPRYQKIHDEINENRKKLGLKSVDESFEEWKAAGMPKHEEDGWAKRNFKEWMEDPRRDEIERNNKMMVESLREIHANLGKNMADPELRRKQKTKPKLKKRNKRCKCK